jgi:HAD superfamily hydrolase (TIGR01509 family)
MLKALIFDMDGTLTHSDPVHLKAFVKILAPEGVRMDEDVYRSTVIGRTNDAIFASLLPHLTAEEHGELAERKEETFREMASDLKPLDGLGRLLDWADARGLRLGLVTNAPVLNAQHMLEALGIAERFAVRITIDDVARGKPDPLPYLTALERLGITPDEALVFEDSPSGMRAAKAAGIFGFGILTGMTADEMAAVGADRSITDFHDPVLWQILEERLGAA